MALTNATIRHSSRARRPIDDQRGTITRYWESGTRRAFVEVVPQGQPPGQADRLLFMRAHPNVVWVSVTPSPHKQGKFVIARASWLVPDNGAIDDAEHEFRQRQQQQP